MTHSKSAIAAIALTLLVGCQSSRVSTVPTTPAVPARTSAIHRATVEAARSATAAGDVQFVDVRTAPEFKAERLPNSVNIPLDEIESRHGELEKTKPIYIVCQTGQRSMIAAKILVRADFSEIHDVTGGIDAWRRAKLPIETR
jgi:rhodanese-related sulfurtransferase